MVARGYVILGRTSQKGGGLAHAFRVARCRTRSGVRIDGLGLASQVPSGHVSRVIRQIQSGPVGSYRVPTGFRRNPDLAQRDPTGLDGSLDCYVSVHDRCTDPLGTPRRPQGPSGGSSGPNGPSADPRRHRRTLFNRRLPGLGGPQLLLAQPVLLGGIPLLGLEIAWLVSSSR